jgi:hypothetical protein
MFSYFSFWFHKTRNSCNVGNHYGGGKTLACDNADEFLVGQIPTEKGHFDQYVISATKHDHIYSSRI